MFDSIKKYIKGDSTIWVIIIGLSIFSLLAVYSATGTLSYLKRGGNTSFYMFKQMASIISGIGIIILMSNIHYRLYSRFALPFLYLSILLLLYAIFSGGINLNDTERWAKIPLIGISFQPSEIAKLAIIVYVARILGRNQGDREALSKSFWNIMIHTLIVVGLIFKDNLSTAVLIFGVVMIMMFIGKMPAKYLLGTVVVSVALFALLLFIAPKVGLKRAETWTARVERFFSPEDAENKHLNYQSDQAKIAIASGGFIGKGPGNSEQRNFIPHPYSDFIYAIIGEEYGFWGACLILAAYIWLLGRVGVIVRKSSKAFPAFMVLGLGFLLAAQAFINMGVSVGIFPVTGQPLPLVSMGTTSIFSTCVAFGAILCVSSQNEEEAKGKKEVN